MPGHFFVTKAMNGNSQAMMTDQEAIQLARQNRQEGYRAIYDAYGTYLFTLAVRMLRDPHLAEDAVQEAFTSAFRNIVSFEGKSRLKTWLYTILYRAVLKIIKARAGETPDDLEPVGAVDAELADTHARLAVKEVLNRLPERDRALLIMAYWDDLSCREIAGVLSVTENHVKVLLYRARKKFGDMWPREPQEREANA